MDLQECGVLKPNELKSEGRVKSEEDLVLYIVGLEEESSLVSTDRFD